MFRKRAGKLFAFSQIQPLAQTLRKGRTQLVNFSLSRAGQDTSCSERC